MEGAYTVGFLLIPNFPLMPYAAAIEPLRAANLLGGRDRYRWLHFSPDGQPVRASNGIAIAPDRPPEAMREADLLVVCAGTGVEGFDHPPTLARLRDLARHGTALGAVSGGPYLLARAGVLDGHRFTLHWDHHASFTESFPDLEPSGHLFEIDRGRLTCSGGIAALDLMQALIGQRDGAALAAQVADWFMHTQLRHGDDPQRLDPRRRFGVSHPGLLAALAKMEERIEEPLSRPELAAVAGLSLRQLERLFRDRLGRSLAEHYLDLRLRAARRHLRQTTLSVTEVALACGFVSASHFSRSYRTRFGHPPAKEREG